MSSKSRRISEKVGANNTQRPPLPSSHREAIANSAAAAKQHKANLAPTSSVLRSTIPPTQEIAEGSTLIDKDIKQDSQQPSSTTESRLKKRKQPHETPGSGLYAGVDVIGVDTVSDTESDTPKNTNPMQDIDEFFEHPIAPKNGDKKLWRRCKTCKSGYGCLAQETDLVNEHTTLRQHMGSKHKAVYRKWCKRTGFVSMIPEDTSQRRPEANMAMGQSQFDSLFPALQQAGDKPVLYSDDAFREAAIRWLIETDQPLEALEHPAFKKMVNIAARAPNGVVLPGPELTRKLKKMTGARGGRE